MFRQGKNGGKRTLSSKISLFLASNSFFKGSSTTFDSASAELAVVVSPSGLVVASVSDEYHLEVIAGFRLSC